MLRTISKGNVKVKIKKQEDEWVGEWNEDGKVNQPKSIYTDSFADLLLTIEAEFSRI